MTFLRPVVQPVVRPVFQDIFPNAAPTMTLHVDSASGSDGNDGLTAQTPLASLAQAELLALAYGDGARVALAAGSEWNESLNLSQIEHAVVESYGDLSGNGLPVIRGDDAITGSWVDSAARGDAHSNTFSQSWTHSISAGSANGGPVVYQDGEMLQWQPDVAAVDAAPGSYHHDGAFSETTPVTLYVHPFAELTAVSGTGVMLDVNEGEVFGGKTYTVRLHGVRNNGTKMQLRLKSSGEGSDWTPTLIGGANDITTYEWTPGHTGNVQLRWFSGNGASGSISLQRVEVIDTETGKDVIRGGDFRFGSTEGWAISARSSVNSMGSPVAIGSTFSATRRHTVIRMGDKAIVRNLRAHAAGDSLGSLVFGRDGLAENILATGNPVHDINGKTGTMRRCVAWHPHRSNGFGMLALEFFDPDPQGGTATWDKCVVVGPDGSRDMGLGAFGGHNAAGGQAWSNWTIRDCVALNAEVSIADTERLQMDRVDLRNGSIYINGPDGGTGVDAQLNDVQVLVDEQVYASRSYVLLQGDGAKKTIVDGFRAHVGEGADVTIVQRPENMEIRRSAFSVRGENSGPAIALDSGVTEMHLDLSGSVFDVIDAGLSLKLTSYIPAGGSFSSQGNVFNDLGQSPYRINSGTGTQTYFSLSALRASETVEAGSVAIDPQFSDPANGDWTLGATSIPADRGLEQPAVAYTPIPATLADAEAWITGG